MENMATLIIILLILGVLLIIKFAGKKKNISVQSTGTNDITINKVRKYEEKSIAHKKELLVASTDTYLKTKRCPYCGEEILEVAKKCKHCGEFLETLCSKNTRRYEEPATINFQTGGISSEITKAVHETKSYVGSAFLTWLLYYIGFYIIGLIMNCVFLSQANHTRQIINRDPSGIGCLRFLLFVHFWLPILLGVILGILIISGDIKLPESFNY